MRHAIAIFFTILLSFPLCVKRFVLLHFMAYRAFIVEPHCENRDKNQMHCEGKCYPNNHLQKAETLPSQTREIPLSGWQKKWDLLGNDGAQHWAYYAEYDSLTPHFEHMYEAVVVEKEMPQTGSPQLTEEELDAFECWKQAGFPN